MNKLFGIKYYALLVIVLTWLVTPLYAYNYSVVQENVPDPKSFDSILARDLDKYFSSKIPDISKIQYELLRESPTQSGVAYPKYYLWIVIKHGNSELTQGAVRVAAEDRRKFEVTHYMSQSTILKDTKKIFEIFPEALCPIILERARGEGIKLL